MNSTILTFYGEKTSISRWEIRNKSSNSNTKNRSTWRYVLNFNYMRWLDKFFWYSVFQYDVLTSQAIEEEKAIDYRRRLVVQRKNEKNTSFCSLYLFRSDKSIVISPISHIRSQITKNFQSFDYRQFWTSSFSYLACVSSKWNLTTAQILGKMSKLSFLCARKNQHPN